MNTRRIGPLGLSRHLLVYLGEELTELVLAISKVQRFGLDGGAPMGRTTNATDVNSEALDVLGVAAFMGITPRARRKARREAQAFVAQASAQDAFIRAARAASAALLIVQIELDKQSRIARLWAPWRRKRQATALGEVFACIDALRFAGLLPDLSDDEIAAAIEAKHAKMEKYMQESRDLGTLAEA